MSQPADPLRRHLELALAAYGPDLPLPVPGMTGRDAPESPSGPDAKRRQPDQDDNPMVLRFGKGSTPPPPKPTRPPAAGPTTAPASNGRQAAADQAQEDPRGSFKSASGQNASMAPASAAQPGSAAGPWPEALRELRREVLQCQQCKLCESRRSVVFGEGNPAAEVLFVGEAPGAVEDRSGRPFVGPSGQLLERIIEGGMGLQRDDVFIANIVKCRPPGNRDPEPDEVAQCLPYLQRLVALLEPKAIVALGRVAAQNLLSTNEKVGSLRGRELSYAGIPVVVTYHPSYLLREPERKRDAWLDIQRLNRLLGRPEDPRRS